MLQEELDMLFLLEHFSLEDLVKAEEEYVNYVLILILLDHALREQKC